MTASEFRALCESVYGSRPVMPMMEDLGVTRRTIERWFSGEFPVPSWIMRSIEKTRMLRGLYDDGGEDA